MVSSVNLESSRPERKERKGWPQHIKDRKARGRNLRPWALSSGPQGQTAPHSLCDLPAPAGLPLGPGPQQGWAAGLTWGKTPPQPGWQGARGGHAGSPSRHVRPSARRPPPAPGTDTRTPPCRGGSYLPRRCPPPVRLYSRLTGLHNRQTAPGRSAGGRQCRPLVPCPGPGPRRHGGHRPPGGRAKTTRGDPQAQLPTQLAQPRLPRAQVPHTLVPRSAVTAKTSLRTAPAHHSQTTPHIGSQALPSSMGETMGPSLSLCWALASVSGSWAAAPDLY